jgi:hypothetical protein
MKYRVYDKYTGVDITDCFCWVITPNGELKYNEYGDLIGLPEACYMIELEEDEDILKD